MQVSSIPVINTFPAGLTYQYIGIPTPILANGKHAFYEAQLVNKLRHLKIKSIGVDSRMSIAFVQPKEISQI
ncbi:hypothetical protein D3C78_1440510 [compost metagenome]